MKYTLLHFGVIDINTMIPLCIIEHYAMKLHGKI